MPYSAVRGLKPGKRSRKKRARPSEPRSDPSPRLSFRICETGRCGPAGRGRTGLGGSSAAGASRERPRRRRPRCAPPSVAEAGRGAALGAVEAVAATG